MLKHRPRINAALKSGIALIYISNLLEIKNLPILSQSTALNNALRTMSGIQQQADKSLLSIHRLTESHVLEQMPYEDIRPIHVLVLFS